jgi:hypothetical protein
MGEMSDFFQDMEERFEEDFNPTGRRRAEQIRSWHPFIWTRHDDSKIHVKDMNQFHLKNAIAHLDKVLKGEEKPTIYFTMLKRYQQMGGGITADQISELLSAVTKRQAPTIGVFKEDRFGPDNPCDVTLKLEDDGDAVALVVCDHEGEQEYPLLAIRRGSTEIMVFTLPEDSLLGPWAGPGDPDK